jgi:hypothetical protein
MPGEFVAFISPRWHHDAPPWLTELAEHELLEYRVAAAPSASSLGVRRPFTLDARIEFDASATLVRHTHAVHRLSDDPEDLAASPAPSSPSSCSPTATTTTASASCSSPRSPKPWSAPCSQGATIASAVQAGAAAESGALDDERLARISALLADLAARKAILGPV